MTKSPRKKVPDVGIELGAVCMPSELASDRATAPGWHKKASSLFLNMAKLCMKKKYIKEKTV